MPTPEADRAVPVPPQPGAGAPGEPAQEQPAQEQLAQRGWWRRHPILSGGVGIIVVLFVFISVVGSLGGGGGGEESAKGGAGQEHNKKSTGGGTASTDGRIVFRRYLDLELTRSAIFTMYPNGSHIRQITNPPEGWGDDYPAWSPIGRRSPSNAGVTRASSDVPRIARGAGSWSLTSKRALRARSHTAYPIGDGLRRIRLHHPLLIAWETPNPPSHPTVSR